MTVSNMSQWLTGHPFSTPDYNFVILCGFSDCLCSTQNKPTPNRISSGSLLIHSLSTDTRWHTPIPITTSAGGSSDYRIPSQLLDAPLKRIQIDTQRHGAAAVRPNVTPLNHELYTFPSSSPPPPQGICTLCPDSIQCPNPASQWGGGVGDGLRKVLT